MRSMRDEVVVSGGSVKKEKEELCVCEVEKAKWRLNIVDDVHRTATLAWAVNAQSTAILCHRKLSEDVNL